MTAGEGQVVRVYDPHRPGSLYAYRWRHVGDPLAVGDEVMLPANWVSEMRHGRRAWRGVVGEIGDGGYTGPLSEILRRAPEEA